MGFKPIAMKKADRKFVFLFHNLLTFYFIALVIVLS